MSRGVPRLVPALISFPASSERQESWGRLLEVRAAGASLLTRAPLERGERLELSFDLPGERLAGVQAEVMRSSKDPDGYTVCELLFGDEELQVRLGRSLRRILAAG